jgi:hypothetical protein
VVKGAFVELPRWFADAGKVQDLEARIAWSTETYQGIPFAEAAKTPFGRGEQENVTALASCATGPSPAENGGNCYNGRRISKSEISYGTIGPSLYNYGKNRGITSMTSATVQPTVDYPWLKLYNPRSCSACSRLPRFGHAGPLAET